MVGLARVLCTDFFLLKPSPIAAEFEYYEGGAADVLVGLTNLENGL